MKWAWLVVALLAACGTGWAFPVSFAVLDLNGPPLKPGDAVEAIAEFTPDVALAPGELIIHQFKVALDGTRTTGRQFDIISIEGPGATPETLIYTIENQACVTGEGYEVCSEVVSLPVYDAGWAWSGAPVLEWSHKATGALALAYPEVPAGQPVMWTIRAVVE